MYKPLQITCHGGPRSDWGGKRVENIPNVYKALKECLTLVEKEMFHLSESEEEDEEDTEEIDEEEFQKTL